MFISVLRLVNVECIEAILLINLRGCVIILKAWLYEIIQSYRQLVRLYFSQNNHKLYTLYYSCIFGQKIFYCKCVFVYLKK